MNMSFYGTSFIFDGVPSEKYNLYIAKLGGSFDSSSSGGAGLTLIKNKPIRQPNHQVIGYKFEAVLEFELSLYCDDEQGLDRNLVSQIRSWLFESPGYKKLEIMQNDLYDTYFNCILKNDRVQNVGGLVRGFTCTVECDAPWAWGPPTLLRQSNITKGKILHYYNESHSPTYTYPQITIKMPATDVSDLTIINVTDNNREFKLTKLKGGDLLHIDNQTQYMYRESGLPLLKDFNYAWLRLLPGNNKLLFQSTLSEFKMAHENARKVGS